MAAVPEKEAVTLSKQSLVVLAGMAVASMGGGGVATAFGGADPVVVEALNDIKVRLAVLEVRRDGVADDVEANKAALKNLEERVSKLERRRARR